MLSNYFKYRDIKFFLFFLLIFVINFTGLNDNIKYPKFIYHFHFEALKGLVCGGGGINSILLDIIQLCYAYCSYIYIYMSRNRVKIKIFLWQPLNLWKLYILETLFCTVKRRLVGKITIFFFLSTLLNNEKNQTISYICIELLFVALSKMWNNRDGFYFQQTNKQNSS